MDARILSATYTIALFLSFSVFFSQENSFINYTQKDGLPSENVYYGIQDHKGYFWFTTDKGVLRYDGYKFEHYTTNNGLADNENFYVYEDSKQRVWFPGYNGELSYFLNDTFYSRKNNNLLKNINSLVFGRNVLEDSLGNIYFATHHQMCVIDINGNIEYPKSGLDDQFLNVQFNNSKEVIALGYNKEIIFLKNYSTKKTYSFPSYKHIAPTHVSRYLTNKESNLLFYSSTKKLVKIDLKTKQLSVIADFPHQVQQLKRFSDSSFWVGTHKGLYLFDWKNGRILDVVLKESSITSLFTDHEGNLWVTTINDGIYVFLNKQVKYLTGLPFSKAYNVLPLKSGQFVISSNNFNGIIIKSNGFTKVQLPIYAGYGLVKKVIPFLGDKFLVLASTGITIANEDLIPKKVYSVYAKDILIRKSNQIYLATSGGVLKATPKKLIKTLKNWPHDMNIISPYVANKLYLDTFQQRLYCFNKNSIKYFDQNDSLLNLDNDSIFNFNLRDIEALNRKILVIASEKNGLKVKYNKKDYYISEADGLCSNLVNAISRDNDSSFWAATINGLTNIKLSFSNSNLRTVITNYYASDGLIANSINDVFVVGDTVWLTSNSGVCYFNKHLVKKTISKPLLNLEGIIVNGITKGVSKNYIFNHNENSFRIRFVGISLGAIGNLTYRYRLLKLEEKWHETKNLEIEYSLLPPGDYQFQLQAFKDIKQESEMKLINIQILPAFYQTTWFKILLFVILFGGTILISYVAIRNNKRKSIMVQNLLKSENRLLQLKKEEADIKNQLYETRQKSLGLQLNPHFVFNAFNAVQEYILTNDSDKAHHYLTEFSKLIRQFLNNNRDVTISIADEISFLESYITLEQQRLRSKITLNVTYGKNINSAETMIPAMLLQPIVENSIWHGLRKVSQKTININVENWQTGLKIEIDDNGTGIVSSFKSSSMGLKITRERIKLAHQQNFKDDYFTLINKPKGGALVTIILPKLESLYYSED